MKKKIGELTLGDLEKICKASRFDGFAYLCDSNCPLLGKEGCKFKDICFSDELVDVIDHEEEGKVC